MPLIPRIDLSKLLSVAAKQLPICNGEHQQAARDQCD
jgi:hypothetical protein